MSDPKPVLEDLRQGRFGRVLLYEDVFDKDRGSLGLEAPSLSPEHLEVIAAHYALLQHVPGPLRDGVYAYGPKSGEPRSAHLSETHKANP